MRVRTDDGQLLRRIGQGDEDAMAAFYREHGRVVLAQVLLVTGERVLAEEIVQDTMLAVWRGAASFRGESSARSWVIAIARRTLIPSSGGSFQTQIIGTSARSVGQINTYEINVAAGTPNLNVAFRTADDSADNVFSYYLVDPSGNVVATATTPQTVNGQPSGDAALSTADPVAGLWQIDVALKLTVSGNEFTQTVFGDVTDGGGG